MEIEILRQAHLTLRPLHWGDLDAIFALRSSESNAQFLDRPICTDRKDAEAFVKKILGGQGSEYLYWVLDSGSFSCIGTIGLWRFDFQKGTCDIGYEVLPEFQGKGNANAALKLVLAWAQTHLPIQTIEAEVADLNEPSVHLLKKHGFVQEATEDGISIYSLHLTSR